MANRVGQQMGNYRLMRLLGRGGFADVYLGEHQRLNTLAAIKVLHTRLSEDDEQGFLQEARMIAHLEHPHIVRVLDFDVVEGVPYLVMQYAPNGNLRQIHPNGTVLPFGTIMSYTTQITDALQYAHDLRLIHRDIKPENMLVGRHNDIVLSDFGLALIAQSSHLQRTQDILGTLAYMAPEQLQGKPCFASDQYALGIVVYEWLCGIRPFSGNAVELFSQRAFVPPPPLHEKIPNISLEVEQVVLKALAKESGQRFTSVKAFAKALEQAGQSKPLRLMTTPLSSASIQPSVSSANDSNANEAIDQADENDGYQDRQTDLEKSISEPGTPMFEESIHSNSESEDKLGPSHIYDVQPHANRPTKMPLPPQQLDVDNQPPIYDRPIWNMSFLSTPSQFSSIANSDSQPTPLSPLRPVPLKPRQRKKQSRSSAGISILVGVLIILLIGLVAFLWPSANIIVTIPSHPYTVQTQLKANATSHQDATLKTIPAQTLTFDSSVTGTGHATGSTPVGTVQAQGTVIFTNKDKNNQVDIPTNTIVATSGGVQFVTQAEALALPGSTILVPVKAQNAGANGNVPAGSISVISAASLAAIQQANASGTIINLSVTNSDPTTNGGAGSATSLTSNDVKTEQATLDIQLLTQINAFLAKNVQTGDQTGNPSGTRHQ